MRKYGAEDVGAAQLAVARVWFHRLPPHGKELTAAMLFLHADHDALTKSPDDSYGANEDVSFVENSVWDKENFR